VDRQHQANRRRFLDEAAQEESALRRSTRELGAARELLTKLERTLPSYQRSAQAFEELAAKRLVGQLQADEKTREALEKSQDLEAQRATVQSLEAAVAQSERRIDSLRSTYESDLHASRIDAMSKITQLEQTTAKLRLRREYLELRAPQDGTVKELATTTVGAVVEPGTVLLSLVPAREPLVAEVEVGNEDIGFVREGQKVRLKLATYPFQKYGMLEGTVRNVSADSRTSSQRSIDASGAASEQRDSPLTFKAIVELSSQELSSHRAILPLAAGMQLNAEIVEGRRTVLEYLLSPIRTVADEAGRER
jgi:HlyD family secretion protein